MTVAINIFKISLGFVTVPWCLGDRARGPGTSRPLTTGEPKTGRSKVF